MVDFNGVRAFGILERGDSAEGASILLANLAGLPTLRAEHLSAFVIIADDSIECIFVAYLAVSILFGKLDSEILWHFSFLFHFLLNLFLFLFIPVIHEQLTKSTDIVIIRI